QECPAADIASAELIIAVIKALTDGKTSSLHDQFNFSTEELYEILLCTVKNGETSIINNLQFLELFGICFKCSVSEFWIYMAEKYLDDDFAHWKELKNIFNHGSLS